MTGAIVVGYLPAPEGEAALAEAVTEARRRDARLHVVVSRRHGEDPMVLARALDSVRDRLDEAGVGYEVREMERGSDASQDILAAVDDVSAQLVVVGLRRRTATGKLNLGANVQRIILEAASPVLCITV